MNTKGKPHQPAWEAGISTTLDDGVLVVSLTGRLGHVSAGRLQRTLEQHIDEGARRVAIDLDGVNYIGSAGLLALDAAQRLLHRLGGQLALCGLTEPTRLAFELAGWLDRFTVEPSRADAIGRLRS